MPDCEQDVRCPSREAQDQRGAAPEREITVLDCGYAAPVGALKAIGALRMGLDESEFKPLVDGLPLDADGYECAFYMKD